MRKEQRRKVFLKISMYALEERKGGRKQSWQEKREEMELRRKYEHIRSGDF